MGASRAAGIIQALLEEDESAFGVDPTDINALLDLATSSFSRQAVVDFFSTRVDPSFRYVVLHDDADIDTPNYAIPKRDRSRYIQLDCIRPDSSTSAVASKMRRGVLRFAKAYSHVVIELYTSRNYDDGFMLSFRTIPISDAPEGYRPWWSIKKTYRRWREKEHARLTESGDDFELSLDWLDDSPTDFTGLFAYLDQIIPGKYSVEHLDWDQATNKGRLTLLAQRQEPSPGGLRLRRELSKEDIATISRSTRAYFLARGYTCVIRQDTFIKGSDMRPTRFAVGYARRNSVT